MQNQNKSDKKPEKQIKLRLFNGRGHGKYIRHHIYVAAKSMVEAAKLVSKACYDGRDDLVRVSEIKIYYNKDAWGNKMNGIIPSEPCVYLHDKSDTKNKPFRVI